MDYKLDYSEAKNSVLESTRGVGFKEIINAIEFGGLLDDKDNPNQKKYPKQKVFAVRIGMYVYAVPYVIDHERQVIFLKTFYPSRKLTKLYIKTYEK